MPNLWNMSVTSSCSVIPRAVWLQAWIAGYYPEVFKKIILSAPAATLKDDAIKGECQGTTYDPVQIPDKIHVHEHTIGGFYFRIAQSLPIYGDRFSLHRRSSVAAW